MVELGVNVSAMKQHIVLVNPEIPQNTGNIARLCVALESCLHLIYPLGFSLDSKYTKRAGLDYWDKLKLYTHSSVESFFQYIYDNNYMDLHYTKHYALSSKASQSYFDVKLLDSQTHSCFLYFGSETKGLSQDFSHYFNKLCGIYLTIPMAQNCRCLNLSNAVAIMGYEVLRQFALI